MLWDPRWPTGSKSNKNIRPVIRLTQQLMASASRYSLYVRTFVSGSGRGAFKAAFGGVRKNANARVKGSETSSTDNTRLTPRRNLADMLALEPRIVFDAAAGATADAAVEQVAEQQAADAMSGVAEANEARESEEQRALADDVVPPSERFEVVFVDASVENLRELLGEIDPAAEVVMIDPSSDGVEQMADALQGREDVDAVHVLTHGSAGELRLGNAVLTTNSISGEFADELAAIGSVLTDDGDILIYGCNFGEGENGALAAAALAEATGADVASSDDPTGRAGLGGDWDLEIEVGRLETETILAENWEGVLAGGNIQVVDEGGQDDWNNPARGDINSIDIDYSQVGSGTVTANLQLDPVSDPSGGVYAGLLFDTDGDGNANVLVLVTLDNTGPGNTFQIADFTFEEGRNDSRPDKVAGNVTTTVPVVSTATLSLAENPFSSGDQDTVVSFTIDLAELGGVPANTTLLNAVTLASHSATSDIKDILLESVGPSVSPDTATTLEDTPVTITVLGDPSANPAPAGTDYQVGFDTVEVADPANGLSAPSNGTAVANTDGTIIYTPNTNFSGTDAFEYQVRGIDGNLYSTTVTVNVVADADAPVILGTNVTGVANTTYSVPISNNLTDTDGSETLSAVTLTGVDASLTFSSTNGTVTNLGGGSWQISQAALASLRVSGTTIGTYTIGAAVTSTETSNSDTAQANTSFTVRITAPPVVDLDASDNTAAGSAYSGTFIAGAGAVQIADADTAITDADDINLESATIVLTNAQAGDVLSVEALPAGISATIDTIQAGQITLTLTSDAADTVSLADYQTAIEAVRFNNSLGSPSTVDRNIEVTVNDGGNNSNTAVSTIGVLGANNPPVANSPIISVNEGTTGTALGITAPTDPDPTHVNDPLVITVTAIPSTGTVYYLNGGTRTAITTGDLNTLTLTEAQLTSLTYDAPMTHIFDGTPDTVTFEYSVDDGRATTTGVATIDLNDTPCVDLDVDNDSFLINNSRLYYGRTGGIIGIVNIETGQDGTATTSPFVTGYINALASNPDNDGIAYYGSGTTMYYWDPNLGSGAGAHAILGDLSVFPQFTGLGLHSGGAAYYDGALYIAAEDGVNGGYAEGIYKVDLAADGRGITGVTRLGVVAAAGGSTQLGALGDIVVTGDGADVTIYGATTLGGTSDGFWSYDTATGDFTVISTTYPGQLAADEIGNLYAGTGTGIYLLDKATGSVGAQVATVASSIGDLTAVLNTPRIDPDSKDYRTNYTESGPAVSIANIGDTAVVDSDDTYLESGTIVLTNPDTLDRLLVNGSAAATGTLNGISYTITNSGSDITIAMSGTATKADYLSFIEAVTFENTGEFPAAHDRVVQTQVNDGQLDSPVATTMISITEVNDNPLADNGATFAIAGTATGSGAVSLGATNPLTAVTDPDVTDGSGETLTITVTGLPTLGTVYYDNGATFTAINAGDIGSLTLTNAQLTTLRYDPPADYDGLSDPGDFTYSVSDGRGGTATGLADIVLNDPPVANNDGVFSLLEDSSFTSNIVSSNDVDNDGDMLTITTVDGQVIAAGGAAVNVTNGTVSLAADGRTITFTPTANYNGSASFNYTVSDGHTTSNTATASFNVTPVPDATPPTRSQGWRMRRGSPSIRSPTMTRAPASTAPTMSPSAIFLRHRRVSSPTSTVWRCRP